MKWHDVQRNYPDQWVVVEALDAYTTYENICHIDEVSVIDKHIDGGKAMNLYRHLHKNNPQKEYYFIHTSRNNLDIPERKWLGIRGLNEIIL